MAAKTKYFRVGPSIWLEPWTDDARYVAFYLLTCPHRSTEGIYRLPVEYAVADLGWSRQRFGRGFDELLLAGFAQYDSLAAVVLIEQALAWQAPENPNQIKAAVRAVGTLPQTPLLTHFLSLAERFAERFAKALVEGLPERFAHTPSPPPALTQHTRSGSACGDVISFDRGAA